MPDLPSLGPLTDTEAVRAVHLISLRYMKHQVEAAEAMALIAEVLDRVVSLPAGEP